jgi:carbonic anhydrase
LIPKSIPIYGYIYDVRTGQLEEVPGAMAAGKAL